MSQHSPAHNVIVQIKVKLLGVNKPPVWRRLQLRADTRLDRLHEILQAALGWENYHMHVFSFGEQEFGIPDRELGLSDKHQVTLGELVDLGAGFRYTYDFGDDWEHEILVEDLLDADPDTHYPALVAAKGACPPEDCGGPWASRTSKRSSPTPTTTNTKTCSSGSASTTPANSTPPPSPPRTSTTKSPSPAPAAETPAVTDAR